MAKSREILQFHVESSRVTQLIDGRRIQRKNDRIPDCGKFSCSARDHRLNRVFGTFAVAPIFEPPERQRRILPASIEAKTSDGDKALDFRLFQKITFNLPENC